MINKNCVSQFQQMQTTTTGGWRGYPTYSEAILAKENKKKKITELFSILETYGQNHFPVKKLLYIFSYRVVQF